MLQTVSLVVSGKVQGVFYRQSACDKARALGIGGTVRNNSDGSVTIIATAEAEPLDELIAWSKKGPAAARVTEVKVSQEILQSFNDFRIVR